MRTFLISILIVPFASGAAGAAERGSARLPRCDSLFLARADLKPFPSYVNDTGKAFVQEPLREVLVVDESASAANEGLSRACNELAEQGKGVCIRQSEAVRNHVPAVMLVKCDPTLH